ncbi:hypothetical protein GCM10027589_46660 [Actinocorallia lasiicapitis]
MVDAESAQVGRQGVDVVGVRGGVAEREQQPLVLLTHVVREQATDTGVRVEQVAVEETGRLHGPPLDYFKALLDDGGIHGAEATSR